MTRLTLVILLHRGLIECERIVAILEFRRTLIETSPCIGWMMRDANCRACHTPSNAIDRWKISRANVFPQSTNDIMASPKKKQSPPNILCRIRRFVEPLAGCPYPSYIGDGECDEGEWSMVGSSCRCRICSRYTCGTPDLPRVWAGLDVVRSALLL